MVVAVHTIFGTILAYTLVRDRFPGRRLLDSTSGNMGIAYATLGAALGVEVTLALPANASPERIAILRALGTGVGAEGGGLDAGGGR